MLKVSDFVTTTQPDLFTAAECAICGEKETMTVPRFESIGHTVPPALLRKGWGVVRLEFCRYCKTEGDAVLLCPKCTKKAYAALNFARAMFGDGEAGQEDSE